MDVINLKHGVAPSTSLTIYRYGATITSWSVDGHENLFLSSKAVLDGTKAIRGGIPICFPSFGPWKYGPAHGLARISPHWKVLGDPKTDATSGDVHVSLELTDDDSSRATWNHQFRFRYDITLRAKELELNVDIINKNEKDSLDFTFALHTYFKVDDISQVKIGNFKGLTLADKALNFKESIEDRDWITVNEFVDRVYKNSPDQCTLQGLSQGRQVQLFKENMDDIEVWNPWQENTAKMADMADHEYQQMICVEPVQTCNPISLPPGQSFKAMHRLEIK